jgi:hypothetical protein
MNSNHRKDSFLNSAVLFAAWLIVIVASVDAHIESSSEVVRIAYVAE